MSLPIVTTRPRGSSAMGHGADIDDYGGAFDKHDCRTERVPYAWSWYQEYTAMLGDWATTERRGFVYNQKVAVARYETARTRAAERLVANSLPGTSEERLDYWTDVLAVPTRPADRPGDVRQACAAKYLAAVGPTEANEDAAIAKLLGLAFVRTWRQIGSDLANPPPVTFWPGVNPGPASYDLNGDGAWTSERAHLVVEVTWPPSLSLSDFLYLMNVQLFALLDRLTPAWASFGWATGPLTDGFLLDISQMDFTGLTP